LITLIFSLQKILNAGTDTDTKTKNKGDWLNLAKGPNYSK